MKKIILFLFPLISINAFADEVNLYAGVNITTCKVNKICDLSSIHSTYIYNTTQDTHRYVTIISLCDDANNCHTERYQLGYAGGLKRTIAYNNKLSTVFNEKGHHKMKARTEIYGPQNGAVNDEREIYVIE